MARRKTVKRKPTKGPKRSNALVKRGSPAKPVSKGHSIVPTDPVLQAYMREVNRHPLLSREEEHDLAVKYYETKDRESFQTLVTGNLRFVVKIAYEYVHYRLKLLDLIQEGNMGLVKAVQEFDPYKGVKLTTYAVWWIRSFIQEAILKDFSLVKIGTTQAQKRLFYRLKREQERLAQQGIGPQESVKLLASKFDVREKDVEEMSQRLQSDASLNAPTLLDEKTEQIQRLSDDKSVGVDEVLGEAQQAEQFKKILKAFSETLEGREKVIFSDRMVAEKPVTLKEIGERYGITKERARQLEEKIKSKLREYVKANYPDYHLLYSE